MKVSHGEGPANHTGPESCGGGREAAVEALTGGRAGRVLSHEIVIVRDADAVMSRGRLHRATRQREGRPGPAGSETPRTRRSTSLGRRSLPREGLLLLLRDGSREIPGSARAVARVRAANPKGARRR
jgi:hypothetical protein